MPSACFALQTPISGTEGLLYINGIYYPADFWNWDMTAGHIELPTVSSIPYCDYQTGLRRLIFRAAGTAMKTFNPFRSTFVGQMLPFLNAYVNVVVYGFTGGGGIPSTAASCDKVLISRWNYTDESDGTCRWELEGEGDWEFQNLGANTL